MQGLKHRQKVKSPQKEEEKEEETKFPLAFHAEGKNVKRVNNIKILHILRILQLYQDNRKLWNSGNSGYYGT